MAYVHNWTRVLQRVHHTRFHLQIITRTSTKWPHWCNAIICIESMQTPPPTGFICNRKMYSSEKGKQKGISFSAWVSCLSLVWKNCEHSLHTWSHLLLVLYGKKYNLCCYWKEPFCSLRNGNAFVSFAFPFIFLVTNAFHAIEGERLRSHFISIPLAATLYSVADWYVQCTYLVARERASTHIMYSSMRTSLLLAQFKTSCVQRAKWNGGSECVQHET